MQTAQANPIYITTPRQEIKLDGTCCLRSAYSIWKTSIIL